MEVLSRDAEKFLASPDPRVLAFLFHGSDLCSVRDRAAQCVRFFVADLTDPFSLARLGPEELAMHSSRLTDEAATLGLFQGVRCLWLEPAPTWQAPGLGALLDDPPPCTKIIISAGSLRRDSFLRKLCEQHRHAVAIECNAGDAAELNQLIDMELKTAKIQIDPDVRSLLAALIGPDRAGAQAELNKLVTYLGSETIVSVDDIHAVISSNSAPAQEAVVRAAFEGRLDSLALTWSQSVLTDADAQGVLLAGLRHALAIHWRAEKTGDNSASVTARRTIKALSEAVRRSRREPAISSALALRSFWTVAEIANRQANRAALR